MDWCLLVHDRTGVKSRRDLSFTEAGMCSRPVETKGMKNDETNIGRIGALFFRVRGKAEYHLHFGR
jgi:hypothetical protein